MKRYDAVVYIGRFEPYHNAHHQIRCKAKVLSDMVITIIGSAHQPRTYKNPFLEGERKKMIEETNLDYQPIEFVRDSPYNNNLWASRVQTAVRNHTSVDAKIAIIGHKKDESTFYLDMFPQWEQIEVDLIEPLDATDIRELYFRKNANMNFLKSVVPPAVYCMLNEFKNSKEYERILDEKEYIMEGKKAYANLPYEITFLTSDAVVVQSGHVLMVRRRGRLGNGLWALPGGFFNAGTDGSVKDSMIRELKEETCIPLSNEELEHHITDFHVFDAKNRSARGRTVTHAFKLDLGHGQLPMVRGADDAEHAEWIPVSKLDPRTCFEDHIDIISHFLGITI